MTNEIRLADQLLLDLDELHELAREVQAGTRTEEKSVRKADSTFRTVHVPDVRLKNTLKKLSELLYSELPTPSDHVFGFVKGRGILENATRHLAKPVVIRVDIANFFESISADLIVEGLQEAGYDEQSSTLIADLTTVAGGLAVGLNTSPVLSNLAFAKTDIGLVDLAERRGFEFTRYVDDLVFSGDIPRDFANDVEAHLVGFGWTVNSAKTRYMRRGGSQYVTGLSVSDPIRPRIPVKVKRRMRWKAHYIDKFGYDAYMSSFQGEDHGDHPLRLRGWARHIASIEPAVGVPLLEFFDGATADFDYASSDDYWTDWVSDIG